jgi:rare lipoprotein A
MRTRYLSVLLIITALAACEHIPEEQQGVRGAQGTSGKSASNSRYSVDQDFSPDLLLDPAKIEDAIPREEYVTKAGNKSPYTVLGKTYEVLPTSRGYKGQGGASWYGLKFHGHKTSNGEIYDIYQMTAAHKTLPIPCYVKVTNIANGRTAIVRVNDRGPFHDGRIIDLSYAAATKLGFIGAGTAQVTVEAIDVREWQTRSTYSAITPVNINPEIISTATPVNTSVYPAVPVENNPVPVQAAVNTAPGYIYLQVGAYLEQSTANDVHKKLYNTYASAVKIESGRDQYYRVRIGPVTENEVEKITGELHRQGFPTPMRIR